MQTLRIALAVLFFGLGATALAARPSEFREGKRLYQAGQYREALGTLQAAAKKAPAEPQAHYLIGLAHLRLGEPVQAQQALAEAMRLDPEIRFTSREKFEGKVAQAARSAARLSRAPVAVPAPMPAPAPVPVMAPAAPAEAGESGPIWAYVLLVVCGGFLAVSAVRELANRRAS